MFEVYKRLSYCIPSRFDSHMQIIAYTISSQKTHFVQVKKKNFYKMMNIV